MPTLLVGDFNQRIPRTRAPIRVAAALGDCLGDLVVATGGHVAGIDRQVIDHVAHSTSLAVRALEGFDRHDADGRPLSDHGGVCVVLERRVGGSGPPADRPQLPGAPPVVATW